MWEPVRREAQVSAALWSILRQSNIKLYPLGGAAFQPENR